MVALLPSKKETRVRILGPEIAFLLISWCLFHFNRSLSFLIFFPLHQFLYSFIRHSRPRLLAIYSAILRSLLPLLILWLRKPNAFRFTIIIITGYHLILTGLKNIYRSTGISTSGLQLYQVAWFLYQIQNIRILFFWQEIKFIKWSLISVVFVFLIFFVLLPDGLAFLLWIGICFISWIVT